MANYRDPTQSNAVVALYDRIGDKAIYHYAEHTDTDPSTLEISRVAPIARGSFLGVRRSTVRNRSTEDIETSDPTVSIARPLVIKTETSFPAGASKTEVGKIVWRHIVSLLGPDVLGGDAIPASQLGAEALKLVDLAMTGNLPSE